MAARLFSAVLVALLLGCGVDRRPIRLGLFEPDLPGSLATTQRREAELGRGAAVVSWFAAWSERSTPDASALGAILTTGRTPMITWEPWDPAGGPVQSAYSMAGIAAGEHDPYLRAWAASLRGVEGPVLLRFAHEMNGGWYPWGAGHVPPETYVRAFRHVVDVFRAEGASNVRFVWTPNVAFPGSAPLAPLYPGDAYVDWICLDGFNWGTSQPEHRWQSFAEVFEGTYREALVVAPTRRFMVETASSPTGGDKAAWVRDTLEVLPRRFGRVELLVWFDVEKETDWRVDAPPAALGALRLALSGSAYTDGPLP